VTFPLSAFGAKFRETKDIGGRFKSFQEKSFDLRVKEFDEGYEAPWIDLKTNVFAYRNWGMVPKRLQIAEQRHYSQTLAALLESGTTATSPWDGLSFFNTAHLANPFDAGVSTTFSNYNSSATDPAVIANLQAEMTAMRDVRDANGDKLGVEPVEIWLPTAKFQLVSDLLNQQRLANGSSNPLLGKLTPVHIPDLTDVNDWYLVDTNMIGLGYDPMFMATYMPGDTLGLRFWDESSDFYKESGKLKVSKHIWTGSNLVFPHAIRRIAGA